MNATRLLKYGAAIALVWSASAEAADRSVWPVTPYQVQVYVAVAPQPPLTAGLEAALIADLALRIDATVGSPWNAKVSAAPTPLRRQMLRGIDSLTVGQMPLAPPEPDKILLIIVTASVILTFARERSARRFRGRFGRSAFYAMPRSMQCSRLSRRWLALKALKKRARSWSPSCE